MSKNDRRQEIIDKYVFNSLDYAQRQRNEMTFVENADLKGYRLNKEIMRNLLKDNNDMFVHFREEYGENLHDVTYELVRPGLDAMRKEDLAKRYSAGQFILKERRNLDETWVEEGDVDKWIRNRKGMAELINSLREMRDEFERYYGESIDEYVKEDQDKSEDKAEISDDLEL